MSAQVSPSVAGGAASSATLRTTRSTSRKRSTGVSARMASKTCSTG